MKNPRRNDRPGKTLERVIQMIERVVSNQPGIVIKGPKRIRDRTTGRLREFDIVITSTNAHHTVTTAIECKDRSRPVGVPDVEAFRMKCLRTGIHRGVIVSTAGFQSTAIEKARIESIDCLSLLQAEKFDWCQVKVLEQKKLLLLHCSLIPLVNDTASGPCRIFDESGKEVDHQRGLQIGLHVLNQLPKDTVAAPGEVTVHAKATGYSVQIDGRERVPFELMGVELRWNVESTFLPFEFRTYADVGGGTSSYQTATARVSTGETQGTVALVHEIGRGTKISYFPDTVFAPDKPRRGK